MPPPVNPLGNSRHRDVGRSAYRNAGNSDYRALGNTAYRRREALLTSSSVKNVTVYTKLPRPRREGRPALRRVLLHQHGHLRLPAGGGRADCRAHRARVARRSRGFGRHRRVQRVWRCGRGDLRQPVVVTTQEGHPPARQAAVRVNVLAGKTATKMFDYPGAPDLGSGAPFWYVEGTRVPVSLTRAVVFAVVKFIDRQYDRSSRMETW